MFERTVCFGKTKEGEGDGTLTASEHPGDSTQLRRYEISYLTSTLLKGSKDKKTKDELISTIIIAIIATIRLFSNPFGFKDVFFWEVVSSMSVGHFILGYLENINDAYKCY